MAQKLIDPTDPDPNTGLKPELRIRSPTIYIIYPTEQYIVRNALICICRSFSPSNLKASVESA